jgi:hypothetical protein
MPSYNFRNDETGEEFTDFMSISSLELFLKDNPHITQMVSPISIADPTRLGLRKPDQGFRDVLKTIKQRNRGSSFNTW